MGTDAERFGFAHRAYLRLGGFCDALLEAPCYPANSPPNWSASTRWFVGVTHRRDVGPKFLMALRRIGSPRSTGNTQCSPRLQYPLTVLSSGVGKPVEVQGASGAVLVGDRGEVTPSRWSSPIRRRDGGGPQLPCPPPPQSPVWWHPPLWLRPPRFIGRLWPGGRRQAGCCADPERLERSTPNVHLVLTVS
jgi:hypothetical protein